METFCKMHLNRNKSIPENCIYLTLCTDYTRSCESDTLTLIKNCLTATFKPKLNEPWIHSFLLAKRSRRNNANLDTLAYSFFQTDISV